MGEKEWTIDINRVLNKLPNDAAQSESWRKRSIYKIPASITDLKKGAYKPQIVSIGPYNHGAEHLWPMQDHKYRALSHFLKRSNQCLKTLVEVLTPVFEDVKCAYDQLEFVWSYSNDMFLEMIILDGCFILEILRTTDKQMWGNKVADDYSDNDPIFSYHAELHISRNLRYDLLMLENQIPMLVLEKLASVQNEDQFKQDHGLTKLILNFFSQGQVPVHLDKFQGCLHMLDVHRTSLSLQEPQHRSHGRKTYSRFDRLIRSVTEFEYAGIMIKSSPSRSLRDITFRDGYLRLPRIVVDDALESLCLNLMAFERFHVGAGNEVTSYVYFMTNIIANERDVSLLVSRGIIENVLGSDVDVANLFNSLSSKARFDPQSHLADVHVEVSAYCQRRWNTWKAEINRNYLTTPCVTASVIAAFCLFALTIAQTAFSVLSYVKQSPNS